MKQKILIVCPYPYGKAPSQRFRFEQYLATLKKAGFDYRLASFYSQKAWGILYQPGKSIKKSILLLISILKRIALLFNLKNYNYIFIHREATPLGPPFFEWISRYIWKKKIIYDFDDAIWLEDPVEKGSLKSRLKYKSKVKKICSWSYKVSCGNDYLSSFARNYCEEVILNPTTIDTKYHQPMKVKSEKLTIGWTGTHSTLPYLRLIIPVLDKLIESYEFELLIISNEDPGFSSPYVRFIPWNEETEISDLNKIDIGIMPLTDDIWSKGKCGFKILQYMAVEKPVVASPVGVNTKLIQESEAGLTAENDQEWAEAITSLLINKEVRNKLGLKGRKYVNEHYSVDSNYQNFLSLFN